MHVHVLLHKHMHILCALVQPSMPLPYWFAVIKQDAVIHCLNPNMKALPSIETSLTIQSTGNLHQHHHENLTPHKIILDGCISKYRERHIQFAIHFYKIVLMVQCT